jgi:hypothetical protein
VNYRPHHDKTPRLRPGGACRRHREFLVTTSALGGHKSTSTTRRSTAPLYLRKQTSRPPELKDSFGSIDRDGRPVAGHFRSSPDI